MDMNKMYQQLDNNEQSSQGIKEIQNDDSLEQTIDKPIMEIQEQQENAIIQYNSQEGGEQEEEQIEKIEKKVKVNPDIQKEQEENINQDKGQIQEIQNDEQDLLQDSQIDQKSVHYSQEENNTIQQQSFLQKKEQEIIEYHSDQEEENDGNIQFGKEDDDKFEGTQQEMSEKKIAPWIRSKTLRIQNPVLRLHNEIIEFTEYLQPTELEHSLRNQVLQTLIGLIKDVLPDCEVKCFGSFTTKLYLPNADIDMVIVNENASNKTMYTKIAKMLMSRNDLYESVNLITNAKVPIIKFVDIESQINFDISFNKLDGVKQLLEVEKTLKIYPEMRYLIFVLKCMLRQRDLHETFKGGIGSFLLFCMILTFLREIRRQYQQERRIDEINSVSLGEYMLKFFEFFAIKNDWNKKRIIMQEGGAIIDKYPQDSSFSLISPQDSDHDIGSSSFKIRDVFSVFKNRYHFMTNFNFKQGESVLKYLVNPSGGKFMFTKDEQDPQEAHK